VRTATNAGGESLFLFRSAPERERAAWEFMKFVMGPDFQVDWAIRTGYLPVSRSAASDPRYRAFLVENPFLAVYNEQMAVARTRPALPGYPALSATLGRALESALYGKETPAEALRRAAAAVDRLLEGV
jgi:multiple sugar transport system substrate-binding protein